VDQLKEYQIFSDESSPQSDGLVIAESGFVEEFAEKRDKNVVHQNEMR